MKNLGTLVMIGGGVQQINAVKIAQNSGYKLLVTDRNKSAPCASISDYFVTIDGRNVEDLSAYIMDHKERLNIKGVFTLTELVTTVAVVSAAVGLPSVSISSAIKCQNKKICKNLWIKNGVPTPRGGSAISYDEALSLFKTLNKRVFVKPVVGFGGINAKKIFSEHELRALFNNHSAGEMIVEEYIEGSMHDVNGMYDAKGIFHPMGITDRSFLDEFPVENRTSSPSYLSQKEQEHLYSLLEHSTRSLGIQWGPVKGDAVYSNQEFKMLEVAPRLHGPKSSLYVLPNSGVNCFELSLDVISGRNCLESYAISQKKFSACEAILPPVGSYFKRGMFKEANMENIDYLILKEDNYKVRGYKNSADVPAYIVSTGDSFHECDVFIKNSLNKVRDKI